MFEWLSSPWFWLPPGYTWQDLHPTTEFPHRRNATDIFLYPPLIALGLYFIRNFILFPFIFNPIARNYKVRCKPYPAPICNEALERLYLVNKSKPPRRELVQCCAEIGWQEREAQRWLRQKALSLQMTTMDKFNDWGWQFCYYCSYFIAGLVVVRSKDWYKDPSTMYDSFPLQDVSTDLWWYFMVAASFYIFQTYLCLKQDRKHDFSIMLTHHLVTLSLLWFSWFNNSVQICSMSLFFHECADIPMALGKLFFYCGRTDISNMMAAPFFVLWFCTRLYLYPYWVIRIALQLYTRLGIWFPAYVVQLVALVILFVLHLLWTLEMIPVITHRIFSNEVIVDTRSSGEELSDHEQVTQKQAKVHQHSTRSVHHNRITFSIQNVMRSISDFFLND